MRRRRSGSGMCGTVAVLTLVVALAGCSAEGAKAPPAPPLSGTSKATAPMSPVVVSRSPAGVTTKINVPAHSTEEEYFQACHAATLWMQAHPGDNQSLAERYLAAGQAPGVVGPGPWNVAWG